MQEIGLFNIETRSISEDLIKIFKIMKGIVKNYPVYLFYTVSEYQNNRRVTRS